MPTKASIALSLRVEHSIPVVSNIAVGLGWDRVSAADPGMTVSITVTPPGTVYGPFVNTDIIECLAVLSFTSGTTVTFTAAGELGSGSHWTADWIPIFVSSTTITLLIDNTAVPGGALFAPCTIGSPGGHVYYKTPAS